MGSLYGVEDNNLVSKRQKRPTGYQSVTCFIGLYRCNFEFVIFKSIWVDCIRPFPGHYVQNRLNFEQCSGVAWRRILLPIDL